VVPVSAQIVKAPAFTPQPLSSPPTLGWLTNGGSLSNQRYSPLALINRDNVSRLKALWRASLGGSGLSARSGNQAQPARPTGAREAGRYCFGFANTSVMYAATSLSSSAE
jgi:hypothetical protein